jgi:Bacterial tandem repeat domain 1
MKVSAILSITAAVIGLTSAGLTANFDDLAAKGYRWVTIDGPYGCPAKDDLQQIVKKPTDETELQMIKQHRAYYLLRGDIVKLIQEDPASGISRIHVAGITTDLWTPTKFLSKRPVENAFGVVETPETSGLVPIETESITDSLKQAGVTPAPSTNSTPRSDENERP